MSYKTLAFALFAIIIAFHSCKSETVKDAKKLSLNKNFELVKVKGNYQVKVLDYMVSTKILNDEASLQYMNTLKEEYIIVMDEPKQEFIDVYTGFNSYDKEKPALINYRDIQIKLLNDAINPKHKTKPKTMLINNLKVEYIEMDAKLEGIEDIASYFIYYIESSGNLYTVMAWTLENKKEIYREKVKKMISTFNVKHYK